MSSTKTRFGKAVEFNREVLGFKPPQTASALLKRDGQISVMQLMEEATELGDAVIEDSLTDQVDALVDSIYFAYGTLFKMGIREHVLDEIFEVVHSANMTKAIGVKKGREVEGAVDAIKPKGWVGPEEQIAKILDRPNKSIVLEGPNGAGKSALAKHLALKYNLPVVHTIKPKNYPQLVVSQQLSCCEEGCKAIFDRCQAISGLVYSGAGDLLDAKRLADEAIVIYCTADGERDVDKPHYDTELVEATKDQKAIRAKYEEVMGVIPHIKFNFKQSEYSSLQLK